jgi:hypothetical protein
VSSPEATAVGEVPGAAVGVRGAGGEPVKRRRVKLTADGGGVRRRVSAVVPPRAGPHERADAHREPRHAGSGARQEATAGAIPQRRRRLRPEGALRAVSANVPHRREPCVVDRAARAPRRGWRFWNLLLPAGARHETGEPRPVLPGTALLLLRSVAEERGEDGEPAAAPPPEPDVAFLEPHAAAVGGPHLRRPEEVEARRAPPRRRGVGLAAPHVRRHRPREHQLRLRRRGRRERGRLVLRGGESEQAVAEARRADADAVLVRVPRAGAPHDAGRRPASSVSSRYPSGFVQVVSVVWSGLVCSMAPCLL